MMKIFIYLVLVFVILFYPDTGKSNDSLFLKLEKAETTADKAWILNRIADYYLDVNLDSARYYAKSALELGKNINDFRTVSDAWVNLGNVNYYQGELDSAMSRYEKSFFAIRKTGDLDEIAFAHNRLGLLHEAKGEMVKATEYYYKAIRYFERSGNKSGVADVCNNLGVVHSHFNQHDIAMDYYNKALDIFKKTDDKNGYAQALNNIATMYSDNDQLDDALKYLLKAVDILQQINRPTDLATAYMNIGTLYAEKEMADSNLYYLNLAEKYFKLQNNKRGLASVYHYKTQYYRNTGTLKTAVKFAKMAINLRAETGNMNRLADTKKLLADIYAQQKQYKHAYDTHKKYQELKDSVSARDMQLRFSELKMKYETAKKDKDILLLKKEAQARQNFNTILIIVAAGLIVISGLLFYSFRTKARLLKSNRRYYEQQQKLNKLNMEKHEAENRLLEEEVKRKEESMKLEKEKYQVDIEHKSREILTSAMHIVNKNKILASIRDSLDTISLSADSAFRKKARQLCAEIDRNIHVDSDWDQFKMHFEQVNTGFFEKLEAEFPVLSRSDMKVCAYLKINLSTKEIAQIMNISPAAVHKRFYRLRKKMNLEPNTNLTKYFMGY
ncbi:MAG: tetratricopeptide repeat protein [Bacteroidales bacterium]